MKCPVCDNIHTSMVCPKCGFDSSRDYGRYPTFGVVGKVPSAAALRAQHQKRPEEPEPGTSAVQEPRIESEPAAPVKPADRPEPISAPLPEKKPRRKPVWLAALAAVLVMILGIWIGIGIGRGNDGITVLEPQPEGADPIPVDTAPALPGETDGEIDPPQENADSEKITLPGTFTLKVWAPLEDQLDDSSWLIRMERAFEEAHPESAITWDNRVCTEGDAGIQVTRDLAAAPDVYLYANDQIGSLVSAGALARLEGPYLEQIRADNNDIFLSTVTYVDGGVYGFPVSPNTWVMFYNKAIVDDADITSLESILDKGIVAFDVASSWKLPAFFFAAGGSLFGELGVDAAAGAQFGGEAGYAAARALLTLAENPNFQWDADGYGNAALKDGTIAAYFSDDWDYAGLYEKLGEKLGAAACPTVMIGGERKQLLPFAGTKAVGVNPRSENPEAAMAFAAFLASAQSQKLRFELRGIVPAAAELQSAEGLRSSVCAQAIYDTMNGKSVLQPKIPEMDAVWDPVGTFGANINDGTITWDNYKLYVDALQRQLSDRLP